MINRRQFLQTSAGITGCLLVGQAPAIVKEVMPLWVPKSDIIYERVIISVPIESSGTIKIESLMGNLWVDVGQDALFFEYRGYAMRNTDGVWVTV